MKKYKRIIATILASTMLWSSIPSSLYANVSYPGTATTYSPYTGATVRNNAIVFVRSDVKVDNNGNDYISVLEKSFLTSSGDLVEIGEYKPSVKEDDNATLEKSANFATTEDAQNGIAQITIKANAKVGSVSTPLDVVLVLDNSGSMNLIGNNMWGAGMPGGGFYLAMPCLNEEHYYITKVANDTYKVFKMKDINPMYLPFENIMKDTPEKPARTEALGILGESKTSKALSQNYWGFNTESYTGYDESGQLTKWTTGATPGVNHFKFKEGFSFTPSGDNKYMVMTKAEIEAQMENIGHSAITNDNSFTSPVDDLENITNENGCSDRRMVQNIAVKKFAEQLTALNSNSRLGIVTFGFGATSKGFPSADDLASYLKEFTGSNNTYYGDALDTTRTLLNNDTSSNGKYVIFISDGLPTDSITVAQVEAKRTSILEKAKDMYAIGFQVENNEYLNAVGGENNTTYVTNAEELSQTMFNIVNRFDEVVSYDTAKIKDVLGSGEGFVIDADHPIEIISDGASTKYYDVNSLPSNVTITGETIEVAEIQEKVCEVKFFIDGLPETLQGDNATEQYNTNSEASLIFESATDGSKNTLTVPSPVYKLEGTKITATLSDDKIANAIVSKGEEITYTINLKNAQNFEIVNDTYVVCKVPEGTTLESVPANAVTSADRGTIGWTLESMAGNESKDLKFTVRVKEDANVDKITCQAYYGTNINSIELVTNPVEHSLEADKYTASYKYVSSDGSALPTEISDPNAQGDYQVKDDSEYNSGDTITRKSPTKNTFDFVENGVVKGTWKLTWDKDEAIANGNVEFIGTWTFEEANKYAVTYKYFTDNAVYPLPSNISTEKDPFKISDTNTYYPGQTVNLATTEIQKTYVEDNSSQRGTWTFSHWENTEIEMVDGGVTFKGYWTFSPTASGEVIVQYISASQRELPDVINPTSGDYKAGDFGGPYVSGDKVVPVDPANKTYDEVENGLVVGTWTFKEWDAPEKIMTDSIVFTGSWEFTPAEKYSVTYEYVSADSTPLPADISATTGNLAIFDDNQYLTGETVDRKNNIPVGTKYDVYRGTAVEGTWTLESWNKDSIIVSGDDVKFVGTWKYEKAKTYKVTYEYTFELSGEITAPSELENALNDAHSEYYVGDATEYLADEIANRKSAAKSEYKITGTENDGTWKLSWGGKDTLTITSTGENKFTGRWVFEPLQRYKAEYEYVSADSTILPSEISTTSGAFAISDANEYEVGETVTCSNAVAVGTKYESKDANGNVLGTWELIELGPAQQQMTDTGVTFVGKWKYTESETYTVTYDKNNNNASGEQKDNNKYVNGSEPDVLDRGTITSNDEMFIGWNTEPDGTGDKYAPGSKLPQMTEDKVLYAMWLKQEKTSQDLTNDGVVVAGETINYKLTVTFPEDLSNVKVSDTIPDNTTYNNDANNNGTLAENSRTIVWNLGDVQKGTIELTFSVKVNATVEVGTVVENTFRTTIDDKAYDSNKTEDPVVLAKSSKLEDNNAELNRNEKIIYTITYKNTTDTDMQNIEISDAIPTNTSYVKGSAKLSNSDVAEANVTIANNVITWKVDELKSGETISATFEVRVGIGVSNNTEIQNKATVKAYGKEIESNIVKDVVHVSSGGGSGQSRKYTLTFVSNGGTEIPSITKYSGVRISLNGYVPYKKDNTFLGWYEDKELTQKVTSVLLNRDRIVYAKWEEDNKPEVTPPETFSDDHFAYIIGYPEGDVRPQGTITRAEVATIFFRLLNDDVRNRYMTQENSFSDVSKGEWFNCAISTMSKMGIVTGYPDGTFKPNNKITRAEFATIASRFDSTATANGTKFTDVVGHWAESNIAKATDKGWITGYPEGTFKPDNSITRAESMTLVNRVTERLPETAENLLPTMIKWPDCKVTDWFYVAVQEATNSHYYKKSDNAIEKWEELREVRDWAALEK